MEKIDKFSNFCLALGAAVAGTFSGILQEHLESALGEGVSWGFIFLVLLIFLSLTQYLIENLLSQSRWLRKLLLGKSFIEGYWYDISSDGNLVFARAIIYIYYEDNSLKISGLTRQDGNGRFSSWDSTFVSFTGHKLSYTFEAYTGNAANPIEVGFGELKFNHGDHTPHFYTGYFFDTNNKKIITLDGVKADDHAKEFAPHNGRHEYLQQIAQGEAQNGAPVQPPTLNHGHGHPPIQVPQTPQG